MDYLKMIIFFLLLSTLIDQIFDKSIYQPYIRLMTGFMLILLMIQPISNIFLKEDIVTMALSSAVQQEMDPTFLQDITEEKQQQIKEEITHLLSSYKIETKDVTVKIDEKGTIQMIEIKARKLKQKKKLKTIISNFYNMKESNINISE